MSDLNESVVDNHKVRRLKSARIRECAQANLEEERQAVRIRECAQSQLYLRALSKECQSARIRE